VNATEFRQGKTAWNSSVVQVFDNQPVTSATPPARATEYNNTLIPCLGADLKGLFKRRRDVAKESGGTSEDNWVADSLASRRGLYIQFHHFIISISSFQRSTFNVQRPTIVFSAPPRFLFFSPTKQRRSV
jgi:hypothetical protein